MTGSDRPTSLAIMAFSLPGWARTSGCRIVYHIFYFPMAIIVGVYNSSHHLPLRKPALAPGQRR